MRARVDHADWVGRARRAGLLGIAVLLIAVLSGSIIFADDVGDVRLMVGRSTVIDFGSPIARVSLTSSEIADALVTSPNELLINGKTPGTISMFVWDRSGGIRRFEVVVQRDLARLNEQVKSLFPGDAIYAASNGKSIVLSGSVTNKDSMEKAVNVAAGYVEKKEEVVNLLQVRESTASNQVLLRVRFAEVTRSAMMELGAQLFTGANGYQNVIGRTTTQQQAAPSFDNNGSSSQLTFSDFLNVFLFDAKRQLGVDIKALQQRNLFQTLAEPNLVAESGKEASFLAGGEFPVPIAQPSGNSTVITIVFKEFGIRLNFTPIVNGDRIHLKVRPEVSTLDFANGISLQGFRIPALSTRRAETELELMNGQTFAMAGLLDNSVTQSMQKIPGIGDIPILGLLFKSKSVTKDKTELVVMITPEILPRNSPGVTTELPRGTEQYLPAEPEKKLQPTPPPAFSGPKGSSVDAFGVPTPPASTSPAVMGTPATAAAAVTALTPSARPVVHADAAMPSTTAPAAGVVPSHPIVMQAMPASSAPVPSNPMTVKEQITIDHSQDLDPKARAAADKKQAKLAKEQAERDREQAKKQAELDKKQAELDKKLAAKDAEAAKKQAEAAKKQADKDAEAAKKQADSSKKQAEIDQRQQKAVAEAAAKLKAAQDAYEAELAKKRDQTN